MKDTTSSKLNVKGPKQAEAANKAELKVLRNELKALPEGLLEDARMNYLLDQNIKRKDLQDFQCSMIGKVEAILRANIIESGQNYRKYKVGGYDKGTYERFFRVEPARYMTKAQLTTALRRSFGDSVIKSDGAITKLFSSFDFQRTDEMDWRAFLYMLSILMQPYLFCDALLRLGYAVYSSVGSLDMDCTEPLSLGMIKDMICVPIILSLRSYVKHQFDDCWLQLSCTDTDTIIYAARMTNTAAARAADPDDLKITFRILHKILTMTPFAKFMETATVYGPRDTRSWTCVLEEQYYHPRVLKTIKALRREERSNGEADKFIALRVLRMKRASVHVWKEYSRKRNFLRFVLIGGDVRTQIHAFSLYFDHWRRITLELQCRLLLQRVARGFIARNRKRFIRRIRAKATLVQSNTRKLFALNRYRQNAKRMHWAVCTIQRLIRGVHTRRKVATRLQAYFDTEQRKLEQKRRVWIYWRRVMAMLGIQLYCRRYLKRVNVTRREEQAERIAEMQRKMSAEAEKARVAEEVYKANLSKWYVERKAVHDLDALNENQTAADRKIVLERRGKVAALARLAKAKEREERMAKFEEETTDMWLRAWEEKITRLGSERRAKCEAVLLLPETPDDLKLQKDLNKRIKAQIKDVLRRADKMKIPMEIPEATVNATKEIVDFEVEAEMERARQEMRAEAERLQKQKEEREKKDKEDEDRARIRRKKWAAVTMQGYCRAFLARRLLRQRAYKRYTKHFDPTSHNYYYEDKRTHLASWEKPASLGSYDIIMENYWILIHATAADGTPVMHKEETLSDPEDPHSEKITREVPLVYYYNPSTWKQVWTRPEGTVLCDQCNLEFARRLLNYDQRKYCESCFAGQAQMLVNAGMHPKYVTFKAFQGGSEKAARIDFFSLPDDSWFMLIMDANPALKQSEEEEVAAVKRARKKALAGSTKSGKSGSMKSNGSQRSGKYGQAKALTTVELCEVCDDRIAILTCKDCELLYCQSCSDVGHSIASHAFHTITTYVPEVAASAPGEEGGIPLPAIADAPKAEKSRKSRKSKKSRKSRREKSGIPPGEGDSSSAAPESGMESGVDTGLDTDTDASWLSKPNYGTGDEASTAGSALSGDKKSKKKHKKRSKDRDAGEVSEYTDTDVDGVSSGVEKKSKHKKHKRSKSDIERDAAGDESDYATDTSAGEKKKHKKRKHAKSDAEGPLSDTGSAYTGASGSKDRKHKKHRDLPKDSAGSGDDTAPSGAENKKKKHHKSKHSDHEDSGADGGKPKKHKYHHPGDSDGTPSKAKHHHKKSKHGKDKERDAEPLGGDFADAFGDMRLGDSGNVSGISSPEKDRKKKHKHKKSKSSGEDGRASGGYATSGDEKPERRHKKDKKDKKKDKKRDKHGDSDASDGTRHRRDMPAMSPSSSFKLPDIFKKSSSAPTGSAAASGDEFGAARPHKNKSKEKKHKHHKHSKASRGDKTPEASDLSSPEETPKKHRHKH